MKSRPAEWNGMGRNAFSPSSGLMTTTTTVMMHDDDAQLYNLMYDAVIGLPVCFSKAMALTASLPLSLYLSVH